MISEQLLKDLGTAFAAQQARLASAHAEAPPGPLRDQLGKVKGLLDESLQKFMAAAKKHNQDLAEAVKSAKDALKKAEEAAKNPPPVPKPKPRPVKAGPVHDPHLEEKLQLALRTPFGNRG